MTRAELLAALGAAAATGSGAATAAAATADVPLTLSPYGLIYVPVTVGGADVLAMIDTGSFSRVQVSRRLATRLKLTTAASDQSAQGYAYGRTAVERARTAFAIGSVAEDAAEVTIVGTTLESVAEQVGTPFEVLLGWGFVRERACSIDYPRRRFAFVPGRSSAVAHLPYREVNRAPIVDVVAAGKSIAVLFDTGAPTCTLETSAFDIPRNTFREVDYTIDGLSLKLRTLGRDLSVNARLGIQGILGTNALERYAVGVDATGNRFVFS